ncbi:MAG: hypothetical protein CM15mP93_03430 [Thiotrichaceae bacterium]|nr:MAG: hypothetical protein CM15mP93_03430 [Thiotrichaceae bacterium]
MALLRNGKFRKNAMKKLISKNLNIIAANKVGENLGIDSDENEIILFWGKNNNLKLEKRKSNFSYRVC